MRLDFYMLRSYAWFLPIHKSGSTHFLSTKTRLNNVSSIYSVFFKLKEKQKKITKQKSS